MTNKQDDKKLIELAANLSLMPVRENWNSLDNNEDAFKLAVDCAFTIEIEDDSVWVASTVGSNYQLYDWYAGDKYKAVRRAITKVAALTAVGEVEDC
jgi:hypothetical protein